MKSKMEQDFFSKTSTFILGSFACVDRMQSALLPKVSKLFSEKGGR